MSTLNPQLERCSPHSFADRPTDNGYLGSAPSELHVPATFRDNFEGWATKTFTHRPIDFRRNMIRYVKLAGVASVFSLTLAAMAHNDTPPVALNPQMVHQHDGQYPPDTQFDMALSSPPDNSSVEFGAAFGLLAVFGLVTIVITDEIAVSQSLRYTAEPTPTRAEISQRFQQLPHSIK